MARATREAVDNSGYSRPHDQVGIRNRAAARPRHEADSGHLGEDGWELVQVVPGPNNPEQLVAYLKREKQA